MRTTVPEEPEATATEARQASLSRRVMAHAPWVALVLAVALAVRIVWVVYAPSDPLDGRDFDDSVFYFLSATGVSEGDGYVIPKTDIPTAQWPPGYSFFLGGVFALFGVHVELAWAANVVLGALTCAGVYALGCLIGGRRLGVAAGLVLALLPGHVFFSALVMSETLFTFLLVAAMALAASAARRRERAVPFVVAAGVAAGLAALVRGQALFFIPVAAITWLLTCGWRRAVAWTGLTMVVAVAVIVPWTVRNWFAMDGFVFISTNDGRNLYMGNYEEADGRVRLGSTQWIVDEYAHLPRNQQEVAANNRARNEALEYMFTHPSHELELVWMKLRALYADDQEGLRGIPNQEAGERVARSDLLGDIANGYFFAMLTLSAGGFLIWLRRPARLLALPALTALLFTLGQLLFFNDPRFHFPMLPSFALLAPVPVLALWESVRRRLASRKAPVRPEASPSL